MVMPITSTKNFRLSSGFGVSNSIWPRWARSKIGSGCIAFFLAIYALSFPDVQLHIVGAPPELGFTRVRQYHCPSRQQPTWMREPGIHNHDREYGFRACAKWRIPE